MNSLALAIAVVISSFVLLLAWHHLSYLRQRQANGLVLPLVSSKPISNKPWMLLSLFLMTVSIGIYSQTGRYHDWQSGKTDEHLDYLLAADITKGRQGVEQNPNDTIALLNLAQSYAAGGMYRDAVDTLEQLLTLKGEDAELLGMKATAMYYRDGRNIAPETGIVIARALAIHREELQTRLLLATDAYLKGEYARAIEHWQILLENRTQAFNRGSIINAISKAQLKMQDQPTEPQEQASNMSTEHNKK